LRPNKKIVLIEINSNDLDEDESKMSWLRLRQRCLCKVKDSLLKHESMFTNLMHSQRYLEKG